MSTPWLHITDGRIAANQPGDTVLMTDYRNDLEHLKERADQVGINSLESIHDNFAGDTLDSVQGTPGSTDYPVTWDIGFSNSAPVLDQQPQHACNFPAVGANAYCAIAGSKYRMRVDLDADHTLYFECRHRSVTSDAGNLWVMGLQDASLALSSNTSISTVSNMIGFRQDASAQKYKAFCSKAGVSVDVATALGNAAIYSVLRIEVTFSGATKKVEFFVDGTSVASTTDTAKLPLVKLRPFVGFHAGGGVLRQQLVDYVDADWVVRPLSA